MMQRSERQRGNAAALIRGVTPVPGWLTKLRNK